MDNTFKNHLYELLKTDQRVWNEESKEFNETLLKDLIDKLDEKIIKSLLNDNQTKEKFFLKINDAFILKQQDLKFFIDENKLDNSYTKYRNKIGLRAGSKLLTERDEVVLDWPFKDTILEGGMTKEDQKRNEIFFNEVLAQDEIDRLLDPKALVNWKRYTKKGEEKVTELKRDENGTIRENLIIKGNNLLALHTLKEQFTGKVKLIYIDPPYNTGDDSFGYNDRFNHSTWLVFMKNRLETALSLLSNDGAIFVQIDLHEIGYLKVLLDEVFGSDNFVQLISIKTASPAGFKTVNPGPIDVTEYILFYTKNKSDYKFKRAYVPVDYNENYNLVIKNYEDEPEQWILEPLTNVVYAEHGIEIGATPQQSAKNAKDIWGKYWMIIRRKIMAEFALNNAERVVSIRDPHKPTDSLKALLDESKIKRNKVFKYNKNIDENGGEKYSYVINGGALAFYSNKVKSIDGINTPTELLTDLWTDISWDGIASEGGVKLKNGKKPEKLLQRIIDLATEKGDIVLDYHLGSGTTAAAAHKMQRLYIGIEQLDYSENDSISRLNNVIAGDQSGISRSVNWQGGGDYVYLELARWNVEAKEKIFKASSLEELERLFGELYERYFLNYNVRTKEFKEKTLKEEDFRNMSLDEQKKLFIEMLDMNQMYVNFSERHDKKYNLSPEDISLSEEFYNSNK